MSQKMLPVADEVVPAHPEDPGFSSVDLDTIGAVSEDHHAVQEIGKAAMEKNGDSAIAELVSEHIYQSEKAWAREWLQNHESACIRRAKFLVRESNKYPDGWLTQSMWVNAETGETVVEAGGDPALLEDSDEVEASNIREVMIPRPIRDVLEAAKTLGYQPTIRFDLHRDERRIVTQDNGDGMTPTEFDEHFNHVTGSGSKADSETGGMIGIGSESDRIIAGDDGQTLLETRSTIPKNGELRPGFMAASSLAGGHIVPGGPEDGFIGTRFRIPVKSGLRMNKIQDWVEQYAEKLRVPVIYKEHDAGNTTTDEEYTATYFFDDYDNPPIEIEKPGEFSLVAGPDVCPSTSYHEPDNPNTYLVSMKVERNQRGSMSTLYDVVVQIHDEQQRIIAGPNRGRFRDDVDQLYDNDIVLPEPTADRDRLKRSDESKKFWAHVQSIVKSREMERFGELAEKMNNASMHPGNAVYGVGDEWDMFVKLVKKHGRRATTERRKFKKFVNNNDEIPDFDDDTREQVFELFKKVSYCNRGAGRSSKKKRRQEKRLGAVLADAGSEQVYMAASTGGNFTKRFKVLENTYDDVTVIVVPSASYYDIWADLGFNVLKNVPLTHATDEEPHGYDVPDSIHQGQVTISEAKSDGSDTVSDTVLKLRTNNDSSAIDHRPSVDDVIERFQNDGTLYGHDKLVLFTSSGEENISDHYDLAEYAAIAHVSKSVFNELSGLDSVMTFSEFTDWSRTGHLFTMDGAMTPEEIINDDRMVVIGYRPSSGHRQDPAKLFKHQNNELREYIKEDIRDQLTWAKILPGFDSSYNSRHRGNVFDDAKPDVLFAVAGKKVMDRVCWAFNIADFNQEDVVGMRLSRERYERGVPFSWKSTMNNLSHYQFKTNTPNWDDDSEAYNMMPRNNESFKGQMLLALHDKDIDPSNHDPKELRKKL